MNTLLNFATDSFRNAQKFNSKTGVSIGGFSHVYEANPANISSDFYQANQAILDCQKGAGYWLWKPYFLLEVLKQSNEGDLIFYSDSASHFISPVKRLMELPSIYQQDVIPFELNLLEGQWTKRRCFKVMGLDNYGFENTKQRLASFILLKKSNMSIDFVSEYLHYCTNIELICDDKTDQGCVNFSGFQAHRHDQSIFSLLTKKYQLQAFRDPSQWGIIF